MTRIRCTPLLWQALEQPEPAEEPPPTASHFGDWSATVLGQGEDAVVLCLNDATLLPLVLALEPRTTLLHRFRLAIFLLITRLLDDPEKVWIEATALLDIQFVPFVAPAAESQSDPVYVRLGNSSFRLP